MNYTYLAYGCCFPFELLHAMFLSANQVTVKEYYSNLFNFPSCAMSSSFLRKLSVEAYVNDRCIAFFRIYQERAMHYVVWMANYINEHRHKGYIHPDDLFYEEESHQSGTSQQHSDETLREFEKMRNFTMEMCDTVASLYVPSSGLPIQDVSSVCSLR